MYIKWYKNCVEKNPEIINYTSINANNLGDGRKLSKLHKTVNFATGSSSSQSLSKDNTSLDVLAASFQRQRKYFKASKGLHCNLTLLRSRPELLSAKVTLLCTRPICLINDTQQAIRRGPTASVALSIPHGAIFPALAVVAKDLAPYISSSSSVQNVWLLFAWRPNNTEPARPVTN